MRSLLAALLCAGTALFAAPALASSPDAATLALIAQGIEDQKERYPQLREFSVRANADLVALTISYGYRTHKARHAGGWTAGVPNPGEDGVWFNIDFHDAASTLQIHTQPALGVAHCLGHMRVGFLILEGSRTASVNGAIWQVLKRYGVAECRP